MIQSNVISPPKTLTLHPIAVTVNDLQRTEARGAVLHVGAEPLGLAGARRTAIGWSDFQDGSSFKLLLA